MASSPTPIFSRKESIDEYFGNSQSGNTKEKHSMQAVQQNSRIGVLFRSFVKIWPVKLDYTPQGTDACRKIKPERQFWRNSLPTNTKAHVSPRNNVEVNETISCNRQRGR
jgi:hypothetical protein